MTLLPMFVTWPTAHSHFCGPDFLTGLLGRWGPSLSVWETSIAQAGFLVPSILVPLHALRKSVFQGLSLQLFILTLAFFSFPVFSLDS